MRRFLMSVTVMVLGLGTAGNARAEVIVRVLLRHPAEDEEGGPRLVLGEQRQQPADTARDARGPSDPVCREDPRRERRHLEVFLNVDGEVMPSHDDYWCNGCAPRRRFAACRGGATPAVPNELRVLRGRAYADDVVSTLTISWTQRAMRS